MKDYWVLDIETRGLPEELQREVMPQEWPTGNIKDPEKIKNAVAEKEKAWLEGAALDAARGEVLAIGVILDGGPEIIHGMDESMMLLLFRSKATEHAHKTVVGHNLLSFDIPFLCRRMWKHGIAPPRHWLDCSSFKARWAFDTMLAWSCGNRDQRIGLDLLAWHLGVGRKVGNGKDFAKLYETDQSKALEYLRNDLELTEKIYQKMVKE